jgi:peptidyl-prolyl cis-trans isomerase SurA
LKGDNKWVDYYTWKTGNIDELKKSSGEIVIVEFKILGPQPKSLQEAKGLVTADYQSYLEKKWIEELRNEYKVNVNMDVLHSIK